MIGDWKNAMTSNHKDHVKVLFHLARDQDGYPPADWEHLWALPRSGQLFELDNIPFFAVGVACGDVVFAEPNADGDLVFKDVTIASGHSTIRVVLFDLDRKTTTMDELKRLGCDWEGSHLPKLCAVDIPPEVNYESVLEFLDKGVADGVLDYQEAAIRHT
jgi:hypothetical protein